MAWFMSNVDPSLAVRCADGHVLRFRDAEYRTSDPVELTALRADKRCREAITGGSKRASVAPAVEPVAPVAPVLEAPEAPPAPEPEPIIRNWALNLANGKVHDLSRRRHQCYISDAIMAAACTDDKEAPVGWKLYRRLEDLKRWNKKTVACKQCKGGAL